MASIGRQSSSAHPSEGHIGSLASSHAALGEPLAPLRWPDVDLLIQATHSKPRGRSSTDPAEFSHARAWHWLGVYGTLNRMRNSYSKLLSRTSSVNPTIL